MLMKLCLVCLVSLLTFLLVQNSFAQCEKDDLDKYLIESSRKREQESFVGLKKISVNVYVEPRSLKNVLKESSLQDFAKERLRQKSIFEISENGDAAFRIDVKSVITDKNVVRYFVEASLLQSAVLERDRTKLVLYSMPTWKRSDCGYSALPQLQSVFDKVKELVDEFINDSLPDLSKFEANSKKEDSPFTATYVGGNRLPEVEIFNDSDRTMSLDFGLDKLTSYTILAGTSKKITLTEGLYKYKASAPRVIPLEGQESFQKGYAYSWRFTIITKKVR